MLLWLTAVGCANEDGLADNADGSFGSPSPTAPRDAGMDGSLREMDAASGGGPLVNVRFLHAIPNTGALVVCHDPDGPGPVAADALGDAHALLRAEFGTRSAAVRWSALASGVLTLHRAPSADAGVDGGALDGGSFEPCAGAVEAEIPLPITGSWLAPRAPLSKAQLAGLELLPSFVSDAPITLLGTGVALDEQQVEARVRSVRDETLQRTGNVAAAEAAGALERAALQATFGARTLIQPDHEASSDEAFQLAVLHAVPDVPPAAGAPANSAVGALRVCITAGQMDQRAFPPAPAPGIPFRVRTVIGDGFTPRLEYEFRAYAAADLDARDRSCATTSASPVARGSYAAFRAGHSYTLALVGSVAPSALCGADRESLVRASCSPPPSELGARIEVLED